MSSKPIHRESRGLREAGAFVHAVVADAGQDVILARDSGFLHEFEDLFAILVVAHELFFFGDGDQHGRGDFRRGFDGVVADAFGRIGAHLGIRGHFAAELAGFGEALDPSNRLVVTWGEYVAGGTYRVWGQKLDGSGAEQWTAGGRLLHTAAEVRSVVCATSDASGRTWVLIDSNAPTDQLLAIPVGADGTPATGAPITVCRSEGNFLYSPMVTDGAGGMIAAWLDERHGLTTPYAQRVDRWGQLGAQPNLTQVIDAPDDQGGYVHATWTKSPLDTPPSAGVNKYRFWREVPTLAAQARALRGARVLREGDDVPEGGAPVLLQLTSANGVPEYWEYVGEMLADGRATYTASIATASMPVMNSPIAKTIGLRPAMKDGCAPLRTSALCSA